MKLAMKLMILPMASLLTYTQQSWAGPSVGGGGQSILCYVDLNARNQVASELAEAAKTGATSATDLQLDKLASAPLMADLYMGNRIGLSNSKKPVFSNETADQIYARLNVADPEYMALLKPYITKEEQWRGYDSGVVSIRDSSYIPNFPRNCVLVQVAFYDDQNNVVNYNTQIVDRMDQTSQTALKLHEDNYKLYRETAKSRNNKMPKVLNSGLLFSDEVLKVSSSDTVRPLVAYLVSNPTIEANTFTELGALVAVDILSDSCSVFSPGLKTIYKKKIVTSLQCR